MTTRADTRSATTTEPSVCHAPMVESTYYRKLYGQDTRNRFAGLGGVRADLLAKCDSLSVINARAFAGVK